MCDEKEDDLFKKLEQIFLDYRSDKNAKFNNRLQSPNAKKKETIDKELVELYEMYYTSPPIPETFVNIEQIEPFIVNIEQIKPFKDYIPMLNNAPNEKSPFFKVIKKIERYMSIGKPNDNDIPTESDMRTYENHLSVQLTNPFCSKYDYYKRFILYSLRVKLVSIYNKRVLLLKLKNLQFNEAYKLYYCFSYFANIRHTVQTDFFDQTRLNKKLSLSLSVVMHSALLNTNSCSYLDTTYMNYSNQAKFTQYSMLLIKAAAAVSTATILAIFTGLLAGPVVAILGLAGGYLVNTTFELTRVQYLTSFFSNTNIKKLAKKELDELWNRKLSLTTEKTTRIYSSSLGPSDPQAEKLVNKEINEFNTWHRTIAESCSPKYFDEVSEVITQKYLDYDLESFNYFDKYELLFTIYLNSFATCKGEKQECSQQILNSEIISNNSVAASIHQDEYEDHNEIEVIPRDVPDPRYQEGDIVFYYGTHGNGIYRGKKVQIIKIDLITPPRINSRRNSNYEYEVGLLNASNVISKSVNPFKSSENDISSEVRNGGNKTKKTKKITSMTKC
jgi:hypothetical protein